MLPSLDEFLADLSYSPPLEADITPERYAYEINHRWYSALVWLTSLVLPANLHCIPPLLVTGPMEVQRSRRIWLDPVDLAELAYSNQCRGALLPRPRRGHPCHARQQVPPDSVHANRVELFARHFQLRRHGCTSAAVFNPMARALLAVCPWAPLTLDPCRSRSRGCCLAPTVDSSFTGEIPGVPRLEDRALTCVEGT